MTVITEYARAKINLTLRVLGRRVDGYHELESLVVFADVGDIITLDTGSRVGSSQDGWNVTMSGPFAHALTGDNLIATTLQRLTTVCPALRLGGIHLDKQLPVASGLGGGSADAAAVLRAVRRANADNAAIQDICWHQIAASLGSDVPVCFANANAWMQGIGDRLQRVHELPELHAVLVNALGVVPPDKTARVFRALNAPPFMATASNGAVVGSLPAALVGDAGRSGADRHRVLLAFMREHGNGVMAATQEVVPDITDVLTTLNRVALGFDNISSNAGSKAEIPITAPLGSAASQSAATSTETLVSMSGAGPTCFVLVPSAAHAMAVASSLRKLQPEWWIAATRLGQSVSQRQ